MYHNQDLIFLSFIYSNNYENERKRAIEVTLSPVRET